MEFIKKLDLLCERNDVNALEQFKKDKKDYESKYIDGIIYRLKAIRVEGCSEEMILHKKMALYKKAAKCFEKASTFPELRKISMGRNSEQLAFFYLVKAGVISSEQERIKYYKKSIKKFEEAITIFQTLSMNKTVLFLKGWILSLYGRISIIKADITNKIQEKISSHDIARNFFKEASYLFDKAGIEKLKDLSLGWINYSRAWTAIFKEENERAKEELQKAKKNFTMAKEKGENYLKICDNLLEKLHTEK